MLYLIVKNNNLLHYLVKSTKQYINNFYSMNKKDSFIKEKLDTFIYDLLSLSQRSISRRSTNDKTSKGSWRGTEQWSPMPQRLASR